MIHSPHTDAAVEVLQQKFNVPPEATGESKFSFWGGVIRPNLLVLIFLGFSVVFIGSAIWVRRTFGVINFDQFLMNIPGLGGGEATEATSGYAANFLVQAIALPLCALFIVTWLIFCIRKALFNLKKSNVSDHSASVVPVTLIQPQGRTKKRFSLKLFVAWVATLAVFCLSVGFLVVTVGLDKYFMSFNSSQDMVNYYVEPETFSHAQTTLFEANADHPNLITIYLESVDALFENDELFGGNLLTPLTDATEEWQRIENFTAYSGGGWTMAGLFGTQCGVPLRGPGFALNDISSNEIGSAQAEFMPGAVCVGDVLSLAGYTNVFLGGADEAFASKGDFLTQHGYDAVKGKEHWVEQGETEFGGWGLSDRALFEQAKTEAQNLHNADEPFHLSVLSLDFHEPAHFFEYCSQTDVEAMTSILGCSMQVVTDFVNYLDAEGILEDTAVVIMADHPKMVAEDGAYWDELRHLSLAERPLFNRIWDPNGRVIQQHETDQLSMFPTLLDLVNLGRPDQQAALGTSVFAETVSRDSASYLFEDTYLELLSSRSAELYQRLWDAEGPALASTNN